MSGETEKEVSAWTIDSLRYHLEQIATDLDRRYEQRFMAQESAIKAASESQMKLLDERYAAQTKMLDERYATQTKALEAAFEAAEKAVQTALLSAEKAVGKAELAADKRFESVNEFRGQLADQANTFLPRVEAEARLQSITEKLDSVTARDAQRISELERRINITQGEDSTTATHRTTKRLDVGQMVAVASVMLAALAVAVTVILRG